MAVEARHLNLFPPQLIGNREIMNAIEGNGIMYNTQMGYGVPISGTTTAETLLPMYSSAAAMADSIPTTKTAMKDDSGLTYTLPVSRKRSRDSINPLISVPTAYKDVNRCSGSFSFLGEDMSIQILQQQLDIDRFISQHMEKVKMEIEERRKRHSRRLMEAVEEGIVKRLRAKEEEIEKIGKLNWALEERVKSLCIENQIWRDLAHSNEATANALRSNLEQVLAQVKDTRPHGAGLDEAAAAVTDDAESCCGSSGGCGDGEEEDGWRSLAGRGGERKWAKDKCSFDNSSNNYRGWCRSCGKEEASVLLLPCRHLCLCTVCGSTLHTCPICKCNKKGSVHVNMS
ncbi:hypothetical protein L1049_022949 [Liquidambar formosana]|uniref:RING-type domain-containing protein n=1 Tax=Liquidambar formosana TaxID=63359 RepID=A0AAP0RD93_LIQFO